MDIGISDILYIAVPLIIVQVLCRAIDHAAGLTERMPFLKKHKILWQIVLPVGFIILLGIVAFFVHMSEKIYYLICGAVLGLINAAAIGVMNDDNYTEKTDSPETDEEQDKQTK